MADVLTAAELVLGRADDHEGGVVFEDHRWTWAQFVEESSARAAWLAQHLEPGRPPHVGVLLENTPDYLFLLGAAALAGVTVVGINPTRRGAELARDIDHTDCQLVVTEASQSSPLEDLDLGAVPIHRVESLALEPAPPPDSSVDPETLFLLLFTSGSTGAPKAVRFSQGRAARSALRVPFPPSEVIYSAMPLFHGNALNAAVFPAWASGCARPASSVLGLGVPARCAALRVHVLQHRRPGHRSHQRHPAATRRSRTHAQMGARARDFRR